MTRQDGVGPSEGTIDPAGRWAAIGVALLALVLGISLIRGPLGRPFGDDYEGLMGGRIQGSIQRFWKEHGFLATSCRPTMLATPIDVDDAPTYGNHPVLVH